MFGLPKPDRSPWRVGHDWSTDDFGVNTADPAKCETMMRQAVRELNACGSLDALHSAWSRHGRVCEALRLAGDHRRADEVLFEFLRCCRARAEAEDIASAEARAEATGSARDSADDGESENVRNRTDW